MSTPHKWVPLIPTTFVPPRTSLRAFHKKVVPPPKAGTVQNARMAPIHIGTPAARTVPTGRIRCPGWVGPVLIKTTCQSQCRKRNRYNLGTAAAAVMARLRPGSICAPTVATKKMVIAAWSSTSILRSILIIFCCSMSLDSKYVCPGNPATTVKT